MISKQMPSRGHHVHHFNRVEISRSKTRKGEGTWYTNCYISSPCLARYNGWLNLSPAGPRPRLFGFEEPCPDCRHFIKILQDRVSRSSKQYFSEQFAALWPSITLRIRSSRNLVAMLIGLLADSPSFYHTKRLTLCPYHLGRALDDQPCSTRLRGRPSCHYFLPFACDPYSATLIANQAQ